MELASRSKSPSQLVAVLLCHDLQRRISSKALKVHHRLYHNPCLLPSSPPPPDFPTLLFVGRRVMRTPNFLLRPAPLHAPPQQPLQTFGRGDGVRASHHTYLSPWSMIFPIGRSLGRLLNNGHAFIRGVDTELMSQRPMSSIQISQPRCPLTP
ncbi:uncharacterized protein CTRU02_201876 [Colletotrichum truncatum]|uniref:Uncharacterized protein n=1 Tax=Colletotrichum truncatum TaxID=5467 RepID=A0ACC3ZIQ0_COLTU|nr:uncharacterized protein CTRU02_06988 [Colletotrichum truncatum]KAF6791804.1 hypothetical protein CTRU02_06988 [Colletotrichum truncatum]